jgi:hypothetical protein
MHQQRCHQRRRKSSVVAPHLWMHYCSAAPVEVTTTASLNLGAAPIFRRIWCLLQVTCADDGLALGAEPRERPSDLSQLVGTASSKHGPAPTGMTAVSLLFIPEIFRAETVNHDEQCPGVQPRPATSRHRHHEGQEKSIGQPRKVRTISPTNPTNLGVPHSWSLLRSCQKMTSEVL